MAKIMDDKIIADSIRVFGKYVAKEPRICLRAGNALDNYEEPPKYDSIVDSPTDEYLEKYYWGILYLDHDSWKYYLPILINYSVKNKADKGAMVIDSFLASLRPPDRKPARLGSLSKDEEKVILELLDHLAFDENSGWNDVALMLLEEYWGPGALYREQK
jgi:hypothetical protein